MKRVHQFVLIGSTVLISWLGMQAIHECGHALAAVLSGAEVKRIVVHPLTISRTDIGQNPSPLFVVWAGPLFGVAFPLIVWKTIDALRFLAAFVFRFFAGFCCVANGAYIAVGSFEGIGDCGEMLRYGSQQWMLWLFGAVTIPIGLVLWSGQGRHFGLGEARGQVSPRIAYSTFGACLLLLVCEFAISPR